MREMLWWSGLYICAACAVLSCTRGKNVASPKQAPAAADIMQPAHQASQAFEGRVTYEEQQVLENQEAQTLRRVVLSFSGVRRHVTGKDGVVRIQDAFTDLRLVEAEPPLTPPERFQAELALQPETAFLFRTQPAGRLDFLTDALERLYAAAHVRFPGKLHENASQSIALPALIRAGGKELRTQLPFLFRVRSRVHTRLQNEVSLEGSYLSTDLGNLELGGFAASCVGKSEISVDFQLDSGVWTRIDAREIIGWATSGFDPSTLAPISVGQRALVHLQMQLTDAQQKQ